jgi:hypothetical protein
LEIKIMAEKKTQVTFAVKSSGQGGAGWIGKVEARDSGKRDDITGQLVGIQGVYFGHPQEYTTHDEHMIDALRKSGVAVELYSEEVEIADPKESPPPAAEVLDEHGHIKDLEFMTVFDLKLKAKSMGVNLKSGQKKMEIVELIREAQRQAAEV